MTTGIDLSRQTQNLAQQINGRALEHICDESDSDKNDLDHEINEGIENGNKILESLQACAVNDEQIQLVQTVAQKRKAWLDGVEAMLAATGRYGSSL